MPSAITRTHRNRRSTRKNVAANRPQPTTPIGISNVVAAGSVLTIVFDQPVALKGVPKYSTNIAGAHAISANMAAPSVMSLTFDAAVAGANQLNVPYEDPAIRNSSGGFVTPTAVKF